MSMTIEELRITTNYDGWYPSHLDAHRAGTFYVRFDLGNYNFARITYYKHSNYFTGSADSLDYQEMNLEEVKKFIRRYGKLQVFA